jgi:hypothetical protein
MATYRQISEDAQSIINARRDDPAKTSARYDEIIKLRMMLLDIADIAGTIAHEPELERDRIRIVNRAKHWGRKGDCV